MLRSSCSRILRLELLPTGVATDLKEFLDGNIIKNGRTSTPTTGIKTRKRRNGDSSVSRSLLTNRDIPGSTIERATRTAISATNPCSSTEGKKEIKYPGIESRKLKRKMYQYSERLDLPLKLA